MVKLTLAFCCLLGVTAVYGDQGFYFPDQVGAKAQSNSDAWSDGFGNSQANANSNAISSGGHYHGGSNYPNFYKPSIHELAGHGFNDYGGRYPSQGYNPDYNRPYEYYPSVGGHEQSNSNAQANSQNFGGNSLSNAIAGSQSLGSNGAASAAAAAASAGTGFVNGVPVSSAAAAASAASSSPNGAGASSAASSANAGGSSHHYPGLSGPYDGGNYNNYDNYDNYNNYNNYNRYPNRRPFSGNFPYRSAGGDDSEADIVDDEVRSGEVSIVFKD